MKGLYDFIVEVEDRYNNKVDVDGQELIVNTEISERDHIFVNRVLTVQQPIVVGCQLDNNPISWYHGWGIRNGERIAAHGNIRVRDGIRGGTLNIFETTIGKS